MDVCMYVCMNVWSNLCLCVVMYVGDGASHRAEAMAAHVELLAGLGEDTPSHLAFQGRSVGR